MARKVTVLVTLKLCLNMDEGIEVSEVMGEMDRTFTSNTDGADIEDDELMDYEVSAQQMSKITSIKVTAIDFDTDGNKKLAKSLASKTIGQVFNVEHEEDEDPLDLLADVISDDIGWCINSLSGDVVEG